MILEFDFLLASVRRFFRPESMLPFQDGLDWTVLMELAYQHGVSGFLQQTCDNPALLNGALAAARSNLATSAELVKLADLFKKEMIDFIPLKGPVSGVALYQDKALKVSTDLDLLVRPGDALRATRLLESIHYRLDTVPHWPSDRACLRNINNELTFSDPAQWLKVDLHWSLLPGYFPSPFDEAELWATARTVPWGSIQLRTLAPEQQLMFLCAHGAKHLWARLGWLCDLARLIQVEKGIDWSEVFARAHKSHTTRMILLGLLLAGNLLGVELPPAAAALVEADPQAHFMATTVLERLRSNRPATLVATATFCVRALERNRQRARLIFGMFLQPTEAEYRVVQVPSSLYYVYYLFRPLRLVAKYTRGLCGF